jgi:hypothetical protein
MVMDELVFALIVLVFALYNPAMTTVSPPQVPAADSLLVPPDAQLSVCSLLASGKSSVQFSFVPQTNIDDVRLLNIGFLYLQKPKSSCAGLLLLRLCPWPSCPVGVQKFVCKSTASVLLAWRFWSTSTRTQQALSSVAHRLSQQPPEPQLDP